MLRLRALVAVVIVVLAACGTDDALLVNDDPVPVDRLPATADDSAMVLETSEQAGVMLRILDLGSSTSQVVEVDRMKFSPIAAGLDSIWYVDNDGDVRSVDWLGVPSDSPAFVAATGLHVRELAPLDGIGGVAVGLDGDENHVETVVVLDADGSVRCSGDFDPSADPTEFGVDLWAFGSESHTGSPVCTAPLDESGLRELVRLPHPAGLTEFVYADGALTGFGPEFESVVQFRRQADGSWSETASTELGAFVNRLELAAGSVWVTTGPSVVRMSAEDLTIEAEVTISSCGDVAFATPLAADGMVWSYDHCDATLARVDPSTNSVDQWALPSDGLSDSATDIRISPQGLWFLDQEQAGEPYFFSFDGERFERLRDPLRDPAISGVAFDVRPVVSSPSGVADG